MPLPTVDDESSPAGAVRPQGDRPTKAARTREALRQVALRRFVDEGFDAANVADIAAEVGVTERTFYRHFATKDEVLFGDIEQRLGWFRDALDARPDDEPLVDSCLSAIQSYPDDPRVMVEVAKLRESLLDHDRIAGRMRDLQGLLSEEIYRVAERRRHRTAATSDDIDDVLGSAVAADVLSAAVFAGVRVWTLHSPDRDLATLTQLISRALETVRCAVP